MVMRDGKKESESKPPVPSELGSLEQPQQLLASIPRRTLALWLLVISLAIFFLPLNFISTAIQDDAKDLETQLASLRASLTTVPTPVPPEVQRVLTPLAQVQGQLNQINAVYPTLIAPRPDWVSIMAAIGNYDPGEIALTSVTQNDNRTTLTLTGRAVRDDAVVAYARSLEGTNLFNRVVVQSILAVPTITPTLTLTPTATALPTPTVPPVATNPPTLTPTPSSTPTVGPTLTPSATPDLRDQYEPDDTDPKPIAFGLPQTHNFYPAGDVDQVYFLAKSGRSYRVYTTDLAPGVDTFLEVMLGDSRYENDDIKPESLNSQVVFTNLGPDTNAVVRVSNRGQFGGDKSYRIVAEEVFITPTPTPTGTPTPTFTPTTVPSATVTRSVTPTPDLRDQYEPDDVVPHSISVGETQAHNFYPDGDIDKVSFPAKAGRYYQVLSSDLALGVDTFITVTLGSEQWMNDDYAPGTGNFASAVCFRADQDGTAVATIGNMAHEYGPDKTYKIKVSEVSNLNAPPCVPSSALIQTSPLVSLSLKPIALRSANRNESSRLAPMTIRFVIVLELKAVPR